MATGGNIGDGDTEMATGGTIGDGAMKEGHTTAGGTSSTTFTSTSSPSSSTRPTLGPVRLGGRIIEDPNDDAEFVNEYLPEVIQAARTKFANFCDRCFDEATLWRIAQTSPGIMG